MPQHPFHGSAAWKKARRVARIEAAHRCQRCGRLLPRGLHVHHKRPVEQAPTLALEPLNFEVVCAVCHNIIEPRTGSRRKSGCDEQGQPLDPQHPWNAEARGDGRKSGA
jgi:5-methylcytosine-specific restriction protein A